MRDADQRWLMIFQVVVLAMIIVATYLKVLPVEILIAAIGSMFGYSISTSQYMEKIEKISRRVYNVEHAYMYREEREKKKPD